MTVLSSGQHVFPGTYARCKRVLPSSYCIHANTTAYLGRKNPGLSPQHLTGLKLVESISHGRLEGGTIRSTEISFTPGTTAAGAYTADTKTAGSCTLMVQQALPCLMLAKQPSER